MRSKLLLKQPPILLLQTADRSASRGGGDCCCTVDSSAVKPAFGAPGQRFGDLFFFFVAGESVACARDLLTVGAPGDATPSKSSCAQLDHKESSCKYFITR